MTQRKNNGGPAFPGGEMFDREYALQSDGMTLRDYFAGQALSGLLAFPGTLDDDRNKTAPACAMLAYEMADAMIAERERGNG